MSLLLERRAGSSDAARSPSTREVQPAAEDGHIANAGYALERFHGRERVGGLQPQQTMCAATRSFSSFGGPSAITRPRYISASRWQYSASSM